MKHYLLVVAEKKLKMRWFLKNHNFMANVGAPPISRRHNPGTLVNLCTKYEFDILIISGSYGGHR